MRPPMIMRQLFDQTSSTFSYLLGDESTREAVLIDCVFERHGHDLALMRELALKLVAVLDTHCHADHVTGAWLMKQALGTVKIGAAALYQAQNVDLPLGPGDVVRFGGQALAVRATPGHTAGCLSFVLGQHQAVFTGDALLVRGAGRTDFQQGDPQQLFTLPDACVVYPAHDYEGRELSTIGEERRHNPRIGGGAREEDFVGYMRNLGLPHPKQMAIAVPANLRSGRPEQEPDARSEDWGPVIATYAGVPEIGAEWLADNRAKVQLVDVRSAVEFDGELGHLEDSRLVPLDALRQRAAELSQDSPGVAICQTGRRAALGALSLRQAGFARVANLAGGMLRWRELGLPR